MRLIGRQHRKEALRLPGRLRDRGQPGALPFRHDPCRIAAGARHDVVAIGFGLVAQAFRVGVGALHIDKAFHHLGWRIDFLQLHLGNLDAALVVVENLLCLVQNVVLDLRAQLGQRRLDRGPPDHLAHRAFRHRLDDQGRVARVEQVADRVADLPEHREVDVDDVLIAGEHQALFQNVASALIAGLDLRVAAAAIADLDAVDPRDGRRQHPLDRPRQVVVEARQRRAVERTERSTTPCSSGWTR